MRKLPIFQANVDEEGTGMFVVSLVDEPAVEYPWQLFSKKRQTFQVENPDLQLITGVVMLADTPIYRYDPTYGEYYIVFSKETIEKMVRKFFKEGYQENVDSDHSFNLMEGIELQQAFIKDTAKGLSPKGFEEVPDGSLFFTYKVTDDDLWEKVKTGSWTGFSLAGTFEMEQAFGKASGEEREVLDLIQKLRERIFKGQ